MKGATEHGNQLLHFPQVSIHAPNEGSDVIAQATPDDVKGFQSTLPMKGATGGTIVTAADRMSFNPRSQ